LAAWLADRYRNDTAFLGLGLLNEPSGTTDVNILHQYYQTAYTTIRATGNDCVLTHAPLLSNQDDTDDQTVLANATHAWMEWHKYFVWGFDGLNETVIMNNALNYYSN
jgi:glucan 1,3-beta-glucosidase